MTPKGFAYRYELNSDELYFLNQFDHHHEFNFPEHALKEQWSQNYIKSIVSSLRAKNLVKGEFPLKLTKSGKTFIKE